MQKDLRNSNLFDEQQILKKTNNHRNFCILKSNLLKKLTQNVYKNLITKVTISYTKFEKFTVTNSKSYSTQVWIPLLDLKNYTVNPGISEHYFVLNIMFVLVSIWSMFLAQFNFVWMSMNNEYSYKYKTFLFQKYFSKICFCYKPKTTFNFLSD